MQINETIIEDLLKYDLNALAYKIGATSEKPELDVGIVTKALNVAERLSRDFNNVFSQQKCLLICGLVWEHRHKDWKGITPFIVRLLTRIGLSPSTIMVDEEFDYETHTYSSLGSFLDETYVASYLVESEVDISEGNSILLSQFQKSIWNAIDKNRYIGISAPTSAGKSYVLINKIFSMIHSEKKKFLFVVPTLSLINQLAKDFNKVIKERNYENIIIHQVIPNSLSEDEYIHIFILTQERLSNGLNENNAFLKGVDLAVFDEIQNIERANLEDDERAKRLYEAILTLTYDFNPHKVIISGPRINNITDLTKELFGENVIALSTEVPPVVNITYSFSYKDKVLSLNQYNYITDYYCYFEIENGFLNENLFGKQVYGEEVIDLINKLIKGLNDSESGSIIFSPTAVQAPKIANMLSEKIQSEGSNAELIELKNYISSTIHPEYSLLKCLVKELAYHHGKMPMHIRNVIEIAFKELLIKNLVCTTTLIQGVNMPAKNIITRNPHLFIRRKANKENPTLSGYEFSNLKGRAGRLMQDFLGRTIILDEEMFIAESIEPSEAPKKEINTGYEFRFNTNEEYILDELRENNEVEFQTEQKDILIYIRQMIVRYGMNAKAYLNRVGITLSIVDIEKIYTEMQKLTVSKEVCTNNRYWDPLTLNRLKVLYDKGYFPDIPTIPSDSEFVEKIVNCIKFIQAACPVQYSKYINIYEEKMLYSIAKTAQKWSLGSPLSQIITWKSNISEDDIERTLNNINSIITYNLPVVLKPLIEITEIENNLLTYLETGLFNPIQRKMVEFGINREVTISLIDLFTREEIRRYNSGELNDKEFVKLIDNKKQFLNIWERKQLEAII